MTTISTETRTARKPRQCDACGGDILTGERYQISTSADRDGFGRWSQHLCCAEAQRYYADGYQEGFDAGWVAEELSTGGDDFPAELRDRLVAASRTIAPDLDEYARTMERISGWDAEPGLKQLGHQDHIGGLYAVAARRAAKCPRLCAAAAEQAAFKLHSMDAKREIARFGLVSVDAAIARLRARGCDSDADKLVPLRASMAELLAALESSCP